MKKEWEQPELPTSRDRNQNKPLPSLTAEEMATVLVAFGAPIKAALPAVLAARRTDLEKGNRHPPAHPDGAGAEA